MTIGWIIGSIVYSVLCGVISLAIAANKNRSGGYFFMGFFLGIIGIIITACLDNAASQPMPARPTYNNNTYQNNTYRYNKSATVSSKNVVVDVLINDYQSGKISFEEFEKKMSKLDSSNSNNSSKPFEFSIGVKKILESDKTDDEKYEELMKLKSFNNISQQEFTRAVKQLKL